MKRKYIHKKINKTKKFISAKTEPLTLQQLPLMPTTTTKIAMVRIMMIMERKKRENYYADDNDSQW